MWRATHTPDGPGTIRHRSDGGKPGLGDRAKAGSFRPRPAMLGRARLHSKGSARVLHPGSRAARPTGCQGCALMRTKRVLNALVPAITRAGRSPAMRRPAQGSASCSCWTRPLPDRYRCCSRPRLLGSASVRRPRFHRYWAWSRSAPDTIHRGKQVAQRPRESRGRQEPALLDRRQFRSVPGVGPVDVSRNAPRGVGQCGRRERRRLPLATARCVRRSPARELGDDQRVQRACSPPFAGHQSRVVRLIEGSGHHRPQTRPSPASPPHRQSLARPSTLVPRKSTPLLLYRPTGDRVHTDRMFEVTLRDRTRRAVDGGGAASAAGGPR